MTRTNRPAADRHIGVARAKRHRLTDPEVAGLLSRARSTLARAGWRGADVHVTPLAVSDSTQTYRVAHGGRSGILKVLPPPAAAASLEAHVLLSGRGIDLPVVLWADVSTGAVLYEDLGSVGVDRAPNGLELARVVTYLARLHAAGLVDREVADRMAPTLAGHGWPTPAQFAARVLTQVRTTTLEDRRTLLDLAGTLAKWLGETPRIIVGDVKREHFRLRGGSPILTDLELVSAWDVIPSNLATLLAFPGQFNPPIERTLRRRLLERYAAERDQLEGTTTDVDELEEAVACAEALVRVTLDAVAEIDPYSAVVDPGEHLEGTRRATMVRGRGLSVAAEGLLSIEHELGPELFDLLRARLDVPRSLRVCDVGCGDGRALAEVRRYWPRHQVIALDRVIGPRRENPVLADAQHIPIRSGSVDLAWGVQLLQYVPDKLACLADVHRILAPDGLAVFAMTEHFDGMSAFAPPLIDLARSWLPTDVITHVSERQLGVRRVLTFALSKGTSSLSGVQPLVTVHHHRETTGDTNPYIQSVYSRHEVHPSAPPRITTHTK